MILQDVFDEIKNLTGKEDDEIDDDESKILDAINRAQKIIATAVFPIRNSVTVTQEETGAVHQHDLSTLFSGKYMGIDKVVRIHDEKYYADVGYALEGGKYLVLPDLPGTFTIYYSMKPTKYTADTNKETTEIELSENVSTLLPIYAAYFYQLNDDNELATALQNYYEDVKKEILSHMDEAKAPEREIIYGL